MSVHNCLQIVFSKFSCISDPKCLLLPLSPPPPPPPKTKTFCFCLELQNFVVYDERIFVMGHEFLNSDSKADILVVIHLDSFRAYPICL